MLDRLDQGAAGIAPGADVGDELAAIYALWREEMRWRHGRFARVLPLLVFESQGIEHYNACAKTCSCAEACWRAATCAHRRPV